MMCTVVLRLDPWDECCPDLKVVSVPLWCSEVWNELITAVFQDNFPLQALRTVGLVWSMLRQVLTKRAMSYWETGIMIGESFKNLLQCNYTAFCRNFRTEFKVFSELGFLMAVLGWPLSSQVLCSIDPLKDIVFASLGEGSQQMLAAASDTCKVKFKS